MVSYNAYYNSYIIQCLNHQFSNSEKLFFDLLARSLSDTKILPKSGRIIIIVISIFVTPTKYSMFLDTGGSCSFVLFRTFENIILLCCVFNCSARDLIIRFYNLYSLSFSLPTVYTTLIAQVFRGPNIIFIEN